MNSAAPGRRLRRRALNAGRLIRDLAARGLLLPGAVALAVAATLVQGVLAREPEPDPAAALMTALPDESTLVAPPEAHLDVLESLRPGLEKTPLSYFADYWLQLGAVARPKLVRVGEAGLPGIVVMRGLAIAPLAAAEPILAARRAAAAAADASGDDAAAEFTPVPGADVLVGLDTSLGIALLRLPGDEASTAFSAANAEELAPGALLAAISLAPSRGLRVIPGHLASTRPLQGRSRGDLDASVPLPSGAPLAALVGLDGDLVGIAVHPGDGNVRFWSYDAVARTVARLASDATCRALEVSPLDHAVAERLGVSEGVIVASVDPLALGPEPPVRPGDVLLQWGGESVADVAAFESLYDAGTPGERIRFRVWRDRRRVRGALKLPGPGCLPVADLPEKLERLGAEIEWSEMPPLPGTDRTRAWRLRSVEPGGAGAAAGLASGEWILAVDGRSVTEPSLEPFQSFEWRGRAAALTVRRENRIRIVPVAPADPDAG